MFSFKDLFSVEPHKTSGFCSRDSEFYSMWFCPGYSLTWSTRFNNTYRLNQLSSQTGTSSRLSTLVFLVVGVCLTGYGVVSRRGELVRGVEVRLPKTAGLKCLSLSLLECSPCGSSYSPDLLVRDSWPLLEKAILSAILQISLKYP